MKITKSQLKQMIQEELKDVQEQQSMMPMSREEILDHHNYTGVNWYRLSIKNIACKAV